MAFEIVLIILGFVLLIKGADLLVEGGTKIAKQFHIPEIIIGLTIVSIGTSMPEFVVSLTSAIDGHPDIAIGNVVGSNISNLFLILGSCAIINGLVFKKETRLYENPITVLATALLIFFANNSFNGQYKIITRREGMVLLLGCIAFILYNIVMASKNFKIKSKPLISFENQTKKTFIISPIIFVILGIVGLKFGGDLIIDNSVLLAKRLGMSEKLISLTILAIATSLPELITSITAAIKGEKDMAIGNILGSQIFNILLIIGVSAIVSPIEYSISYNKDLFLLLGGTIGLTIFPYIGKKNEMSRTERSYLFRNIYNIFY